jgi:hypothetical protein
MTLNTGIFDVSDPQNPDRVYSAALLCRMMAKHIRDGIVHGDGNELAVSASDPPAMTVKVATGTAMVQGRFCENDAALTLSVPAAHATYPRIDRVVVRLNASPGRTIDILVKKGTPAPSPVPPGLTRTPETWELSLAQISVPAGATMVQAANITDERGNTSLCGVAAPAYVPSSQVEVVGAMNMQGHALSGLPAPSGATDAARKGYVDTEIAGAIGGFGISQIAIDADKDWNGKAILNAGVIQNQTGGVGALSGFVDVPGNTTRKSVSSGVSLGQNESATVATVFVPNTYSSAVDSNLRVEISKSSDYYYDHYLQITIKRNGVVIGSGAIAYNEGSGNIDTTGGFRAGDTIVIEAKNAWGGTYFVPNTTVYSVVLKSARKTDIPAYKVFPEAGTW